MAFDLTFTPPKDLLRYVRWTVERREPPAAPEPIPAYEDIPCDDLPGDDRGP